MPAMTMCASLVCILKLVFRSSHEYSERHHDLAPAGDISHPNGEILLMLSCLSGVSCRIRMLCVLECACSKVVTCGQTRAPGV